MFDIGFTEIVVIAVVALVVLGPERLPKAARTLGHLFGRLQRYVAEVKADINREVELDELRKLQQQVKTAARDFETSMTAAAGEVESGVRAVESELNAAGGAATAQAATPGSAMAEAPTAPPAAATIASGDATLAATGAEAAVSAASPASPAESGAAAGVSRQASLPGFERG